MIEIQLAQLHEEQQAIVDSRARFKVVACGRRFGKTLVALDMLTNRLLDGQSVAYFAPTYRMGAEVWRELKQNLQPLIRTMSEHEWRMELYTGGVLECWSLANQAAETVRGRKYHFVVMDEAALFDSAEVWHGAIRPLLTDYEGGALFASTPRGRNWFWHLYLQGRSATFPEWESWCLPTGANPYIKASEIAAARTGMPERFYKQEYEAVFLDDGGVVFRNVERVCVGITSPLAYETLTPSPSPSWRGESEGITTLALHQLPSQAHSLIARIEGREEETSPPQPVSVYSEGEREVQRHPLPQPLSASQRGGAGSAKASSPPAPLRFAARGARRGAWRVLFWGGLGEGQ